MKEIKISYYLVGIAIFFIVMASNFLNFEIFNSGFKAFSVWFVISLFSFILGWILNRISDWKNGLSLLFLVLIFSAIISVLNVTVIKIGIVILDSKIIASLLFLMYDFLILSMSLLGFSLSEVLSTEGIKKLENSLNEETKIKIENAGKKAELIIKNAETEALKIFQENESKVQDLVRAELEIKKKINELIVAEKEILKQYEIDK